MKKMVLVDNSKAVDVIYSKIRPMIKNETCELLRVIEGENMLSRKTYVVNYKGEEVYLHREEIKRFIK